MQRNPDPARPNPARPDPARPNPVRDLARFFGLTLLLSWGLAGAGLLLSRSLLPAAGPGLWIYLAGWAPSAAAVILSLRAGGLAGLGRLLQGLARPFHPMWLVVAALLLPAAGLLLTLLPRLGLDWPVTPGQVLVGLPLVLFGTAQIVSNTGPLGEELGWRGYALPRLLERWTPLASALLIGAAWSVWHVPAFVMGAMGQGWQGFGFWVLDTLALSTVMTWLFLRAGRNVLVAGMIPHFVINGMGACGAWLSRPPEALLLALIAVAVTVLDRRRMLVRPAGLPARPAARG